MLDVPTRWNSTYKMLEAALNVKKLLNGMRKKIVNIHNIFLMKRVGKRNLDHLQKMIGLMLVDLLIFFDLFTKLH